MIVWGGVSDCSYGACDYPADAAAYDPETGRWSEIPRGPLSSRVDHSSVWTGEEMIV
jgi:hypothetical protein